ncbi:hypothetical protein F183_A15760 [Bryobacterales bacterium F-183]|nr:hypothetical protein F183_A15760 [Bryobacterales bacterium F-183]
MAEPTPANTHVTPVEVAFTCTGSGCPARPELFASTRVEDSKSASGNEQRLSDVKPRHDAGGVRQLFSNRIQSIKPKACDETGANDS